MPDRLGTSAQFMSQAQCTHLYRGADKPLPAVTGGGAVFQLSTNFVQKQKLREKNAKLPVID